MKSVKWNIDIVPDAKKNFSVLGMGTGSICGTKKEMANIFDYAISNGINHFDLATRNFDMLRAFGTVLSSFRSDVSIQVHFGTEYSQGKYEFTTDLEMVKKSISMQLQALQTDYIDFGYMHCIDSQATLQTYINNGILDYILRLKESGVIHHIGLSSHSPELVHRVLDMGFVDIVMFSINPAYDYQLGGYANGNSQERHCLYNRIEEENVGLVVMKPFCGGRLLDKNHSPFNTALSRLQCIQYALDKPGVCCVVPGYRKIEDLKQVLQYFKEPIEKRDYSILQGFNNVAQSGCVYCGHCQPCSVGLDISLINKYYDLSLNNDVLATEHYYALKKSK